MKQLRAGWLNCGQLNGGWLKAGQEKALGGSSGSMAAVTDTDGV